MWPSDHSLFHTNMPYQPIPLQFSDALKSEGHFFPIIKRFSQAYKGKGVQSKLKWNILLVCHDSVTVGYSVIRAFPKVVLYQNSTLH